MKTWKSNLEETKQRYINWWNHKGIILNMWEHFQEGVQPHAEITPPAPAKDLSQKWFDPQWRAEYLDWYVAHSSLKADILPVANTQLGPGSLAAILGGHFKGIDYRIREHLITKEISIGDYVLTGGELAAAVMADAIVRIIPGVISDEQSALSDSFQDNLLAAPVYTRPADYKGWKVPDILLSGHEAKIKEWELQQSLERTRKLRPDLLGE